MMNDAPLPLSAALGIDAVVIGASAGGIEALGTLLPALPADFAPPVLVVQHIVPDHASLLAELFADRCAVRVEEASDKREIAGGCIYFAPPDYHLQVEPDRTLALSVDDAVNFSRPSIDVLFESAAWTYGPRLLGILLTGASPDGAAGLLAIRQAGGRTWVQDPATAAMDIMPLAAIGLGAAQEILTLSIMARRLGRAPHSVEDPPARPDPWRT
ncbi:chemotaxis protein CheB [Pigmentiphaga soli]|uniref:protein-glutamate methylesterase n=1 Tax=Pigmentiphaga soli TaxID=1007095 RepID=A0ABP8GUP4_9BURK